MSLSTRSAMLQMRVTPEVKIAGEHVLRRIGISMTQAMELFLRRVIVDERLPFDVIALDDATIHRIQDTAAQAGERQAKARTSPSSQRRVRTDRAKSRRRGAG